MRDRHAALHKYFEENKIDASKFIAVEEYITDPSTEKKTSKWLTRISYLIP